jgi:hypothetical protein
MLLECGARINDKDCNGQTPLHAVCSNMQWRGREKLIIEMLLESGANANAVDKLGKTALDIIDAIPCFDTNPSFSRYKYSEKEKIARLLSIAIVKRKEEIEQFRAQYPYRLCNTAASLPLSFIDAKASPATKALTECSKTAGKNNMALLANEFVLWRDKKAHCRDEKIKKWESTEMKPLLPMNEKPYWLRFGFYRLANGLLGMLTSSAEDTIPLDDEYRES